MEALAIRHLRILLSLVAEDADLTPYLTCLSKEHKDDILSVLNELIEELKND
jgi:hypothetical protein